MSEHEVWCHVCAWKIQNQLVCNNPNSPFYRALIPITGCNVGAVNKPIPENCLKGVYK